MFPFFHGNKIQAVEQAGLAFPSWGLEAVWDIGLFAWSFFLQCSGITWHWDSQSAERLARACVGSIHRGFKTSPESFGLTSELILLWEVCTGELLRSPSLSCDPVSSRGNPPKLVICSISSYSFAKVIINISDPLPFPLHWYWKSSKTWLGLWV